MGGNREREAAFKIFEHFLTQRNSEETVEEIMKQTSLTDRSFMTETLLPGLVSDGLLDDRWLGRRHLHRISPLGQEVIAYQTDMSLFMRLVADFYSKCVEKYEVLEERYAKYYKIDKDLITRDMLAKNDLDWIDNSEGFAKEASRVFLLRVVLYRYLMIRERLPVGGKTEIGKQILDYNFKTAIDSLLNFWASSLIVPDRIRQKINPKNPKARIVDTDIARKRILSSLLSQNDEYFLHFLNYAHEHLESVPEIRNESIQVSSLLINLMNLSKEQLQAFEDKFGKPHKMRRELEEEMRKNRYRNY